MDTEAAALALRVGFAFKRLNDRAYPKVVTQTDLATRVGKQAGRTFTQASAAGWLSGAVPRDLKAMDALAAELDLDHMWLYFNKGEPPEGFREWADLVGGQSPYASKAAEKTKVRSAGRGHRVRPTKAARKRRGGGSK